MKKFCSYFLAIFAFCHLSATALEDFNDQNFSIWGQYAKLPSGNEQQTQALTGIWENRLEIIKNRNIRRVMLYVLSPVNAVTKKAIVDFFLPSKFSTSTNDNILYFLNEIYNITHSDGGHCEVEILYDLSEFAYQPQGSTERLQQVFNNAVLEAKGQVDNASYIPDLGVFNDMSAKVSYISLINALTPTSGTRPLIAGITIDPEGSKPDTAVGHKNGSNYYYQNIINAMDEYRYNSGLYVAKNNYSSFRTGLTMGIDAREMTISNLATFPVTDGTSFTQSPPIAFQSTFPSTSNGELNSSNVPVWRVGSTNTRSQTGALLDSVYIQVYQTNLVLSVFQLGLGFQASVDNLADTYSRIPAASGPGNVSYTANSTTITGDGTFFDTLPKTNPNFKFQYGSIPEGGRIAFDPVPTGQKDDEAVSNIVSNTELTLFSSISTVDVVQSAYKYTPIAMLWSQNGISTDVNNGIYWMYSTNYNTTTGDEFFGNYTLQEFMNFVQAMALKTVMADLSGNPMVQADNIAIYDFPLLPNSWNLTSP